MKRIFISIYAFCIAISFFLQTQNSYIANANSLQYARITSSNARLYKTATENNNISNVICYLDETYFVEVLLNFNIDFYKVSYNGVVGYALKSNLALVNGKPKTPFPISFLTTVNSRCYLRSSPEVSLSNSNTLCVLPANCSKIKYIGKMVGDEVVDYKGSTWYYVEYLETKGYVYNNYVANLSTIYQNLENLEPLKVINPVINPLSTPKCAVLIGIISIPCLFIIILLYVKPKPKVKSHKVINKPIKSRKILPDEEKL